MGGEIYRAHVSEAKMFDPKDQLGYVAPEPKEVQQPGM